MLERWLVSIVINFVLRQLSKFKKDIDWGKVRADLDTRVRALVPGTWFDQEAVAICNAALDGVLSVLSSTEDLERVLQRLAAGDWAGAYEALKALLLSVWNPTGASGKKVQALLAS